MMTPWRKTNRGLTQVVPSLCPLTGLTPEGLSLASETHTPIPQRLSGHLGAFDLGIPATLPRWLAPDASGYRGRVATPLWPNLHKQ